MSRNEVLALKKERLSKLQENGKNIKTPGVVRKLAREVRNMENDN